MNNNSYTVLVVGNDPTKLLTKYDKNLLSDAYIKYHLKNADQIKNEKIKILKEMICNAVSLQFSPLQIDLLNAKVNGIQKMSAEEFFNDFTSSYEHDKNGNALSQENPNGKWSSYKIGERYSYPFQLKDGSKSYQSTKKNIDWDKMHLFNCQLYDRTWDIINDQVIPETTEEKRILSNISILKENLSHFASKEQYIKYNCSYWTYAFLDENGWVDIDDCNNQYNWITTFYDNFILPLKDNEIITIYEYKK